MLFCLTSLLPHTSAKVAGIVKNEDILQLEYDSLLEERIMNEGLWSKNLLVVLKHPEDWHLFGKRPFSVLVHVVAEIEAADLADETFIARYNRYQHSLTDIRNSNFFTKPNLIETSLAQFTPKLLLEHATRPSWREYFMSLAMYAATRGGCMKRKVGAVIVKNNRVKAIGYNGTSTGSLNCCDGGCERCNNNARQGTELSDCFCIHAEESAFLECNPRDCAGAQLFTTVFPCRLCSRKIAQLKITEVFYLYEYGEDKVVTTMFSTAGVITHKLAL
ncbi:dCMP deaminase [Nematocida displodere]|uniref:dCMP deaminase n=1 Tax=Nematocida displodere TaxID=1805483 RepID=A0A177EDZ4_9MICR|nr:dCMP deaminase [Nematocida displodere]